MKARIGIAAAGIAVAVVLLVASSVRASASRVVTVEQIVNDPPHATDNLRLGARVADGSVSYQTTPALLLQFAVHDVGKTAPTLRIVYHGIMPDTLRPGRDVILEGTYDGAQFAARSLLTQCPSKYEPPVPKG